MKYEFMPHTADIRMKIFGKDFKELFSAGVLGMAQTLKEGFCAAEPILERRVHIALTSTDRTCLLVDFLSEVLSYTYTEQAIFCKVDFKVLREDRLEADILGAGVDFLDEEIKAVTYHEAEISPADDGTWQSLILFDI